MTERLYYTDPSVREFDARVLRATDVNGRPAAVLDRSAFYPTSGGQPFDTGTLGGVRVLDVVDEEDGILHVLGAPLGEGQTVHGVLDWERRFDHMQQHTGQHVLSAAFDALLGVRTESFHLGALSATIDLARALTPAEITRAEEDANRIVWENRPVVIRFADASDPIRLKLRKETLREGTLRLIDIDGYDISACGGTHVERTGAIGLIAVASWERFRAGTRVEFLCGRRALGWARSLRETMVAATKLLSTSASDIPLAVERLQAEVKTANRAVRDLQGQLAVYEAERLAAAADSGVVAEVLDGWDQNGLKAIASAVTRRPGYAVALLSAPAPSAIVIARSSDVSTDAAAVLKALIAEFGGKGGGRPELAQGGGLQGDPKTVVVSVRRLLRGQWGQTPV